jgi:hypothetical protein
MPTVLPSPWLLIDGLTMVESGRWHEGRLWLAHWGSGEVIAVDLEGRSEVVGPGRDGMGWSIAWLPDGRLLVSGEELTRVEPNGSAVQHSPQGGNELVVDPAGPAGARRGRRGRPGARTRRLLGRPGRATVAAH